MHEQTCSCVQTLGRIDTTRRVLLVASLLIFTWSLFTASLTFGSVVKQYQGPLLLVSGIMAASYAMLGKLRGAFFTSRKPPGVQLAFCERLRVNKLALPCWATSFELLGRLQAACGSLRCRS